MYKAACRVPDPTRAVVSTAATHRNLGSQCAGIVCSCGQTGDRIVRVKKCTIDLCVDPLLGGGNTVICARTQRKRNQNRFPGSGVAPSPQPPTIFQADFPANCPGRFSGPIFLANLPAGHGQFFGPGDLERNDLNPLAASRTPESPMGPMRPMGLGLGNWPGNLAGHGVASNGQS